MNLNAVTLQYCSLRKLTGEGFGAATNAAAAGCDSKKAGTSFAKMALTKSANSSPVRAGKKGVEWATMSVCCRGPRLNRMAIPRGLALGSASEIVGSPPLWEKRTQISVLGLLKCGAIDRVAASGVGVNVPLTRMPLA